MSKNYINKSYCLFEWPVPTFPIKLSSEHQLPHNCLHRLIIFAELDRTPSLRSAVWKAKTPQGIEPRPRKTRSATTGVFCFFSFEAKKQNLKEDCSFRKRKTSQLLLYDIQAFPHWLFHFCLKLHTRWKISPAPHNPVTFIMKSNGITWPWLCF